MAEGSHVPNPRRVAAGRLNHQKRKGLTADGLRRLREAAYKNQPWLRSTGPRTPEGKARVGRSRNGKTRVQAPHIDNVAHLLAGIAKLRRNLSES